MELAIINGTYRDSSSKNSSREYLPPPLLPPPPRVETKIIFSFSALKVLSSEMDLAEIRLIRSVFIKERGTMVFQKNSFFKAQIGAFTIVNCRIKKDFIQMRIEYSLQTSKLLHNCQFIKRRRSNTLKGSQRMGGGAFFLKPSAPLSLMTTYRMSLISAGSISLDSTFNLDFCSGPYQNKLFNILANTMLLFLPVNKLFRFPLENLVN